MKVACFCGTVFSFTSGEAHCPQCGQPVMASVVSASAQAEMLADLKEILDAHTPSLD